jgi:molecular chaperone DnaK (HSP70)
LVTWQWWRRRREASLLPVLAGDGSLTAASPEAAAWQHRALEAERRVEQAHEAIRAGVLTQVTEVLKENLVHNLITQRKELIEAQQAAALELEALEKRLDEIHAPLQERLRAYEARIAELEKALAAKDEQNRELIKAKIALVRQQLEAERAKNQAVMN